MLKWSSGLLELGYQQLSFEGPFYGVQEEVELVAKG